MDIFYFYTYIFQQECNHSHECSCHRFTSDEDYAENLGCIDRDDLVCPEIDEIDIGFECSTGNDFCVCDNFTNFYCLHLDDCPPTPPPTTSTSTTEAVSLPPTTITSPTTTSTETT